MGGRGVIVWWLLVVVLVVATGLGGGEAAVVKEKRPPCKFPAMYNFGDSNSDTGAISAAFQAIPWPFGMTFFKKPVGRDCDGRLLVDFIAERLGFPYMSAYLNSLGANFSHGANFATGGSTIRRENETIFQYSISPFSLDVQVWHYEQYKSRSHNLYNHARSAYEKSVLPRPEDFSTALYTFDIGQNDLTVAFRTMNDDQIRVAIPDIIAQFSTAIQHLYEQGARSFWVHNTGPIGCLPIAVMYNTQPKPDLDQYGCIKDRNGKAIEFNKQLKDAVVKLRTRLPEAAITYVDLFAAKYGLISKAKSQGWVGPMKICCGYHEKDGDVWCGRKGIAYNGTTVLFGRACSNPELHVSWDGVHHSEAANHWFANQILDGSLSDPPVPITHACYRD